MSVITQITLYERLEQTAQAQNRAIATLILDLITTSLDTLEDDDDSDEYIIASFRQSWREFMTGAPTRSAWDLINELDAEDDDTQA